MTTEEFLKRTHKYCSHNALALKKAKRCGCFFCCRIYDPDLIVDWTDAAPETAICPYCDVDSVLPESTEYPLTVEFLEAMERYWFNFRERCKDEEDQ